MQKTDVQGELAEHFLKKSFLKVYRCVDSSCWYLFLVWEGTIPIVKRKASSPADNNGFVQDCFKENEGKGYRTILKQDIFLFPLT